MAFFDKKRRLTPFSAMRIAFGTPSHPEMVWDDPNLRITSPPDLLKPGAADIMSPTWAHGDRSPPAQGRRKDFEMRLGKPGGRA